MSGKGAGRASGRPIVEWLFGAVSGLVVAGLVAYLAYQALLGDASPPTLPRGSSASNPSRTATW